MCYRRSCEGDYTHAFVNERSVCLCLIPTQDNPHERDPALEPTRDLRTTAKVYCPGLRMAWPVRRHGSLDQYLLRIRVRYANGLVRTRIAIILNAMIWRRKSVASKVGLPGFVALSDTKSYRGVRPADLRLASPYCSASNMSAPSDHRQHNRSLTSAPSTGCCVSLGMDLRNVAELCKHSAGAYLLYTYVAIYVEYHTCVLRTFPACHSQRSIRNMLFGMKNQYIYCSNAPPTMEIG